MVQRKLLLLIYCTYTRLRGSFCFQTDLFSRTKNPAIVVD